MTSGDVYALNMITPLLAAGSTLILIPLSVVIYNLFFHPLRSYPGPWYAKATIFWSQYHAYQGDLTFHVHKFHQRYGPVVRIAPCELVYIDPQAWKDIYGHRNGIPENIKEPTTNNDPNKEHLSIMQAEKGHHTKLRKILSGSFSEKAMQSQEPVIKSYVDLLVQRLGEKAAEDDAGGTDVVRWFNFTTFDIIGHLTLGEPFGCLHNSGYHPWIPAISSAIKFSVLLTSLRRVYDNIGNILVALIPKSIREKNTEVFSIIERLILKRRDRTISYVDFMTHLMDAEREGKLVVDDLVAQGTLLIVAGSETVATLLSGSTFYLLTNPHVYQRVVQEIRSNFNRRSEITLSSIHRLKYLLAFFDEALRMYPPAGGNLPRRTPPQGTVICGKFVPGNTTVGIHQWAQFHSPKNFAEPHAFAPERFLETENPKWKNDRRDSLQPFGFGPRNCIGRLLAYSEMRLILASILWNFDMELVPGQENWLDQKIFDVWEKPPLMVKFKPVKGLR